MGVIADGVVRELDPVRIEEFGLDQRNPQCRENRRSPIQQKTFHPIAQWGGAMIASISEPGQEVTSKSRPFLSTCRPIEEQSVTPRRNTNVHHRLTGGGLYILDII